MAVVQVVEPAVLWEVVQHQAVGQVLRTLVLAVLMVVAEVQVELVQLHEADPA